MKSKKQLRDFIYKHKTEIIITSACLATVGIGMCAYRYKISNSTIHFNPQTIPTTTNIDSSFFDQTSKLIKSNLTGTTLTATELGKNVGLSPQKMNKKIVESGYMTKLASGEYKLTKLGNIVGESNLKTVRNGHIRNVPRFDKFILNLMLNIEQ